MASSESENIREVVNASLYEIRRQVDRSHCLAVEVREAELFTIVRPFLVATVNRLFTPLSLTPI